MKKFAIFFAVLTATTVCQASIFRGLPIGSPCDDANNCISDPNVACIDSKCGCRGNYIPSENKDKCLYLATLIGVLCEEVRQCTEGTPGNHSGCALFPAERRRKCLCTPDAVPNSLNRECLVLATEIGEPCKEPQQCRQGALGEHSWCFEDNSNPEEKTCECTSNALEGGDNFCYNIANKTGDPCEIEEQCTNLGEYSGCLNEKCGCVPGTQPSPEGTSCLTKDALISEPCVIQEQCIIGNSTCERGTCRCHSTLVGSRDKRECLPKAEKLGDPCEAGEHQQCTEGKPGPHSQCFGDTCRCLYNTVVVNETCYLLADFVDKPCDVEEQCNVRNSSCIYGVCRCDAAFMVSRDRRTCLPKAEDIGDPCEYGETQQCTQGKPGEYSDCVDNTCRCRSTAVGVSGVCYPLRYRLGDTCEVEEQCQNLPASHCLDSKCGCNSTTHFPKDDGRKCLEFFDELDKPCEDYRQCRGDNVACNYELCSCTTEDYVESVVNPGNCVQKVSKLNASCTESVQCSAGMGEGTFCESGTCRCEPRYEFYEKQCYLPKALREVCDFDEQCKLGVSPYAACSSGKMCSCRAGALEFEESCWDDKELGDFCTEDKECYVSIKGEVYCTKDNRCEYKSGCQCLATSPLAKVSILASFFVMSILYK